MQSTTKVQLKASKELDSNSLQQARAKHKLYLTNEWNDLTYYY